MPSLQQHEILRYGHVVKRGTFKHHSFFLLPTILSLFFSLLFQTPCLKTLISNASKKATTKIVMMICPHSPDSCDTLTASIWKSETISLMYGDMNNGRCRPDTSVVQEVQKGLSTCSLMIAFLVLTLRFEKCSTLYISRDTCLCRIHLQESVKISPWYE